MYSAPLDGAITAFKYNGRAEWASVFGRLVLGWLDAHSDELADIDLIVGNPTQAGREPLQHIERILLAAAAEDTLERWPFAQILTKREPTPRSAGGGWNAKMEAARWHAEALLLTESVERKSILLFDDVFTTGAQTRELAKMLLDEGARQVQGLVLARTPWS